MSRKMILALAAVAALDMSALTSTSVLAFGRVGGLHTVHPQIRVVVSQPVVGVHARKALP